MFFVTKLAKTLLAVSFFNNNSSLQQDMNIFCDILSVDQIVLSNSKSTNSHNELLDKELQMSL